MFVGLKSTQFMSWIFTQIKFKPTWLVNTYEETFPAKNMNIYQQKIVFKWSKTGGKLPTIKKLIFHYKKLRHNNFIVRYTTNNRTGCSFVHYFHTQTVIIALITTQTGKL